MDYKVLYRKYRPTCFDEVIGQDYTINILKNAFLSNKLSHAFIFTGPRGTGKTSTAKLLAKLVNCENPVDGKPCNKCNSCLNINDNPDVIEIDAASNTGVDSIREIINNVKIAPSFSKYKVYIIDEVHMLSTSAFNALLLTLEEPPQNIIFILATTEIQNVPITILSRCQRFDFYRISSETIFNQLRKVAGIEKINIEDGALREIASIADGGMRDAYSLLDQVAKNDQLITKQDVDNIFGLISNNSIIELLSWIENGEVDKIINKINEYANSSTNYIVIVNKIIEIINEKIKNIKLGNENGDFNYYKNLVYDLIKLYNIKNVDNPYIILEITLLNYCNGTQNYFPGNNLKKNEPKNNEQITENNVNESAKLTESISPEIQVNIDKDDESNVNESNNDFVNIRINNTFVEASLSAKKDITNLYKQFLNKTDNYYKNMLEDSSIAAASDKYAIIVFEHEATANVANNEINKIEEQFFNIVDKNIKFVCISDDYWQVVVEDYKMNKNKKKYEYIDEIEKNNSSVFDSSIIEVA